MLTALIAVLGSVGWALWLLGRQESRSAGCRIRLAEAKAATETAGRMAALEMQRAAESRLRVAFAENAALRHSAAFLRADLEAAGKSPPAEGSDKLFESTTGKLRLYRSGYGMGNRMDDDNTDD